MKYFDDDMDELFNKAGRHYPLKTEPKNWDKVRGALHEDQGLADGTQKSNGWRRLLPLLLLLLIPAVYVFLDKDNINKDNIQNNNNNNNSISKTGIDKNSNDKNGISKSIDKNSISKSEQTVKDPKPPVTNNKAENTNQNSDREVNQSSYVPSSEQSLSKVKEVDESVNEKGGLSGPPQTGISKGRSDRFTQLTPAIDISGDPASWNSFPSLHSGFTGTNDPSEAISLKMPVRSLSQENVSGSVPNSDKKTRNKKGFYYGIEAAPDVSTIKGQRREKMGYSAGVIAGYYINNRLSVEAGALWSKKNYFTKGKYFDKAGAGIPAYVDIHWLNGGCEMIEFPINVRYNFSAKKNTFFGAAGLTSYIMKQEEYDYGADAGPGNNYYEGYKSYNRSGDHLFANLQLSAGYKYSLSSKLNIRIEPYLKMPVKKIGIGKMPITSTGLFFGITRDLR